MATLHPIRPCKPDPEVPAPVAHLFAGISPETLRRCDERDRYWLAVLGIPAHDSPLESAMADAGVAAVLEASSPWVP